MSTQRSLDCAHTHYTSITNSIHFNRYLRERCEIECWNENEDDYYHDERRTIRVLFLGRLVMPKAPGVLLKSIARLPRHVRDRVELLVVGNGYLRKPLQDLSRHLNISNQVIISDGNVPHDDVPKVIASSDIFVFPSLYPEAFGIVGVEAMALGLPIIGFGVGGSSDYLHHMETGLVASPPTPSGLAASLELLIKSRRARVELGQRAMEFVRRTYSTHAARDQWLSVYEDI